ncbi:MAG TPA: single-stranded-DNA-specific exonuclease RecJ [Firmicutes bacterium]|jgi:single-stranded-DNA-specific exonuclease|nr:single-stranded-DNA-specific exonuclease RecJ [Bacillota bacterium]
MSKKWKLIENISNNASQFAQELAISPLLAHLICNRGITDVTAAKDFLLPTLEQLHDPFFFKDMKRAVERLKQAIDKQETVLIYGDYDVDGITSISLMIRVLSKHLPGKLIYYTPKRLEEGYGLHLSSLDKALSKGVTLIITVDCGISAIEEALFLKSKGIDLIITDHHEPKDSLPEAFALIDPKIADSGYPFPQLAGVGVTFKLLQGLAAELPEITERLLANLDLVAFGTVADIVPLLEENRVLVKYGLEKIQKTNNVGLQALIQGAALQEREITSGHIGYLLAPRVNAAGRMANPCLGVKLFLTNDPIQAMDLAKELEKENQKRQEIESQVLQEAKKQIEADPVFENEHAFVLAGEHWHLGVIGIVASKLVEIYNKPVILIGLDGEEGRGSGRSIQGFNLFNALEHCEQHMIKFGGHEFAAGLSIKRENIPAFREAFLKEAKTNLPSEALIPSIQIEGLIELNGITLDLVRELGKLAPCGSSNPTPVLGCKSLDLVGYKSVGENGKHLKLKVSDHHVVCEGIGFNMGFIQPELATTSEVDVAFSLEENNWNGNIQVQLNLKDVVVRGSN